MVLVVYGALLLAGALGLFFAPRIAAPLSRWRYSRWFATFAVDARGVLLGPNGPMILSIGCLVHALTIVVIWSLGRAQGLLLPVPDAAVLFTVMVGVALVPISISGWGLRELAVISLLGHHGISPERAGGSVTGSMMICAFLIRSSNRRLATVTARVYNYRGFDEISG